MSQNLRPRAALWTRLVTSLVVVLSLYACGHRRIQIKAGTTENSNIAVKNLRGMATYGRVDLRFDLVNLTSVPMVIDRNQFAIVGTNRDYFRSGPSNIFNLDPGQVMPVRLLVRYPRVNFAGPPGLYLRLDGIYAGSDRVDAPLVTMGKPFHEPRTASMVAAAAPKRREEYKGVLQEVQDWLRPKRRGKSSEPAPAERSLTAAAATPSSQSAGAAQLAVVRRRISKAGAKCAGLPFKAVDIDEGIASIMDDVLLGELDESGFETIGPDDIAAMLDHEKSKDALGCDDASCVAEIGGALGVDYLVSGSLGLLEGTVVVTLKLIDVRNTKVLARSSQMGESGLKGIPRLIAMGVSDLVGSSEL